MATVVGFLVGVACGAIAMAVVCVGWAYRAMNPMIRRKDSGDDN